MSKIQPFLSALRQSPTTPQLERIVAPSLLDLTMSRLWEFENNTILKQFLVGMFPNLERLKEEGWGKMSTGDIAEVAREIHGDGQDVTPWQIRLDRVEPSLEEMEEVGMRWLLKVRGEEYFPGLSFCFLCSQHREARYVLLNFC